VIGRLTPTPSGYLHLGNARSFLLAWLWAKHAGGQVDLRIEDIDKPRCKPEYTQAAIDDIAWLGLTCQEARAGSASDRSAREWVQSERTTIYRKHLQQLIESGQAYPCTCTRKDIEQASSAPHPDDGPIYPGTCRGRWRDAEHAQRETGIKPAWRFEFGGIWRFHDQVQGEVKIDASTLGDFVLWRRDDLPSYQLAVTVDDAVQGVTQVLRGRDLVASTARQLALYRALGLTPPDQWAHVPFVQDAGRRMAKRDGDLSLRQLRESGVPATRVIGLLAFSAGLLPAPRPATAAEPVGEFDIARIPREDFVLTEAHQGWLQGRKK
jgi:glutamyl-tRNA synthetase